jgi:hypothetical protein
MARKAWNTDYIERYLLDIAREKHPELGEALGQHLCTALKNPLRQNQKDCLCLITELPEDATEWMRKNWPKGGPYYEFVPNAAITSQINHVADWILAAMVNDEAWMKVTNAEGKPIKLSRIKSLDEAVQEADKAMLQKDGKAVSVNGGTNIVMEWPDGYRIVELLTPEELDYEGQEMQNCVDRGAYDLKVSEPERTKGWHLYSLRDSTNKPHATIEVYQDLLLQCKGKQNQPAIAQYMPYIRDFIEREKFGLREAPRYTNLIEIHGDLYDVFHLPDNVTLKTDADFSGVNLTSFPKGWDVAAKLSLSKTPLTQLEDVKARELKITESPITKLSNIEIRDATIDLNNFYNKYLFDQASSYYPLWADNMPLTEMFNVSVAGDLHMDRCKHLTNISNIHVGRDWSMWYAQLPTLSGAEIGRDLHLLYASIQEISDVTVGGRLALKESTVEYIHDANISGDVDLTRCMKLEKLSNVTIGGNLIIDGAMVPELENVTIHGKIIGRSGTVYEKIEDVEKPPVQRIRELRRAKERAQASTNDGDVVKEQDANKGPSGGSGGISDEHSYHEIEKLKEFCKNMEPPTIPENSYISKACPIIGRSKPKDGFGR